MGNLENKSLGRYDLSKEIGRGGTGIVYLGFDREGGREVAVKVAKPGSFGTDKRGRRRRKLFLNEMHAAEMLEHPNIIAVYDAGVEEDHGYMAMEYVAGGETLHDYARPDNLLSLEEVVGITLKCASALDYAHRRGVVHRDIKPRNILLTEDHEVKITDFGVALISDVDVANTQVHGFVGSPLYMSPEQIQGGAITNQTDIFSLGVVLYLLLTGKHPFAAENLTAVTHRITHEAHFPVRELRAELPGVLDHIVDRTLKKHPAGRYAMGLDLAGDLSLIFDHIKLSEEDLSGREKYETVKDLRFFGGFEGSEIWEILNAGIWTEFEPGDAIIEEGEIGNSYYVLVSGAASVKKGSEEIDVLQAGESFGEIGVASSGERTASVHAKEACTVLKVRTALVDRMSANCRLHFHKALLEILAERFSRLTGLLSKSKGKAKNWYELQEGRGR